jgi:hypothetical protein
MEEGLKGKATTIIFNCGINNPRKGAIEWSITEAIGMNF